jgi:hypothetical protein
LLLKVVHLGVARLVILLAAAALELDSAYQLLTLLLQLHHLHALAF